jgi:hypothetical protein
MPGPITPETSGVFLCKVRYKIKLIAIIRYGIIKTLC